MVSVYAPSVSVVVSTPCPVSAQAYTNIASAMVVPSSFATVPLIDAPTLTSVSVTPVALAALVRSTVSTVGSP